MNHHLKKLLFFGFFTAPYVCSSFAQRTVQDMLRPTFDSSQVVIAVVDSLLGSPSNNVPMASPMTSPSYPQNYVLDKTRIAGEVPYETGTSIAGQVEINVPIETFATEYESSPQVAIRYNSQGGLGCLGQGWEIMGLSVIEPVNKTFFTDCNVQGRSRDDGPWSLDGNRLILQETNDTARIFLTQTGNIKVIHRLNGTGYKVYLPDGTVCDYSVSSGNNTFWHINERTSLDGKKIAYSYYNDTGVKLVKSIGYGEGRSINFEYDDAVNEQSFYIDGVSFINGKRLSSIEVKQQDRLLREYVMTTAIATSRPPWFRWICSTA